MQDTIDRERIDHPHAARRPRRPLVIVLLAAVATVAVGIAGAGWWMTDTINRDLPRIEAAFDIPDDERPPVDEASGPAAESPGSVGSQDPTQTGSTGAVTILLAGTDRRSDEPTTGRNAEATTWLPGEQRSDAIMLVRLTNDGRQAYVVSIPRDSWVTLPGLGPNKINAAFSLGGPSLYVQTIEKLTQTRVDHLAVVDWSGLDRIVDALGGIQLTFTEPVVARSSRWEQGTHTLTGSEVVDYVGERLALDRGDFDRVERQQNVLRAIASTLLEDGALTNLLRIRELTEVALDLVSVDEGLDAQTIGRLALRASRVDMENVTFMTAPTAGTGWEGPQSVVYLDPERQPGFWQAFRTDTLEDWVALNGVQTTPDVVN